LKRTPSYFHFITTTNIETEFALLQRILEEFVPSLCSNKRGEFNPWRTKASMEKWLEVLNPKLIIWRVKRVINSNFHQFI